MLVYVGCSLTQAPKLFALQVAQFKEMLGQQPNTKILDFLGLEKGSSKEVYATDLGNVEHCDVFITVCDFPSIGLGMEIQHAIHLKKPTLCLHQADAKITRMLYGAQQLKYLTLRPYFVLCVDGLQQARDFARHCPQT